MDIKWVKMIILLSCLGVTLIITGCGKTDEQPSLPYKKISILQMPAEGRKIPTPRAMCVDPKDNLLVVDDAGRVLIFDKNGKLTKKWMMPATELGHPEGILVLKDGRIAVPDTHYSQVVIFKPDGQVDKIFGKKSTDEGDFGSPVGIAEDPEGNLYVCEYGFSDRVQKFTKDGNFIQAIGKAGMEPDEFQRPSSLIHLNGNIYVTDAVHNRIQIYTDQGKYLKSITVEPAFYLPYDIQLGKDGCLYVVEYGNNCITKLTKDGTLLGRFGMNPKDKLHVKSPWGLAVDSTGKVYIADTGNRRIVIVE